MSVKWQNGGRVSVPIEAVLAEPIVQWNHIDGPLMHWAGRLHWLTFRERLSLWLRVTTLAEIAERRFSVAAIRKQIPEPAP